VYALTESSDISGITDLAVSALSKSYNKNEVWSGFPLAGDLFIHRFLPSFENSMNKKNLILFFLFFLFFVICIFNVSENKKQDAVKGRSSIW